jgi:cytoskeleton protein RodZ
MDEGVGRTLRETRTRRKIDLADVEAATKIRGRYLRAIENEEWDLLPGETYARAFIRAYADHLGLDGERLAEEQRRGRGVLRPGDRLPKVDPVRLKPARRRPRQLPRISPQLLAVVVSAALIAILVVVGLSSGGEGSSESGGTVGSRQQHAAQGDGDKAGGANPAPPEQPSGHVVTLTANAEVWVCLVDAEGEQLIDGQILSAGASEGPYRSGSFTVSFGNGEVTMMVDGQQASIPETASPVGFEIDAGELRQLSEGERPTCT